MAGNNRGNGGRVVAEFGPNGSGGLLSLTLPPLATLVLRSAG